MTEASDPAEPTDATRLEFVPMTDEDVLLWLPESMSYYEEARLQAGDTEAGAAAARQASMDRFFPDGRHLIDGQFLFAIVADGEDVGWLWLGPWGDGDQWWVWDIHVRAPHRRHGYARAAMAYAQRFAREHGAPVLGLNVFANNVAAIDLYESLGFEAASLHMTKTL
ncbi:GNAT family N-acetyltransferase [Agromyces intestinalis]|uniref:GNAT family N-acetyltransferase n=1 Tax=Agromyces intestinalis TaxID=2592652 RepID=A0A5C1YGZ6_9MICO|nr:GNAT family N-acetyltransferase [Agromyces intestinalis]QEO14680.1 GNAT family N-acetyltransferase [Agromyces intestinalis]